MKKLNKIKILFFLLILSIISCSTTKNSFNINVVEKTWHLNKKQVNFPTVIFYSNNTCIFSSMGNTLYRFNYKIKNNYLILEDLNKNISKDKILKVSKDSLIFESLWTNKEKQIYVKNKLK